MRNLIKMLVIPGMIIWTGAFAQPDTVIQNNQNAIRTTPVIQNNPQDNKVHTIQNPASIQHRQTGSVKTTPAQINVSNGKTNGTTQQNNTIPATKQTTPVHHNGARVDSVPSINRNTIYTDSTRVIRKTTPTRKDTIK